MEWGSEPQLHLPTPEDPMHEVTWDSRKIKPKPDALLVEALALGCRTESCSSGCRDTSSGVSEGVGPDERQQGFISSCVLPCCRMIRQSPLSRFPSHPLSRLFGAQTYCNSHCTMKDSPYASGIQFHRVLQILSQGK